jgi:hypothetical protein
VPIAAVQGLLAARKRVPPGAEAAPPDGARQEAEAPTGRRGPATPASGPEQEWPRPCLIERPCRDREEAVALGRRLDKFKGLIEAVRVSARADGVVLKVATRPIPQDVYDSIRDELRG